MSEPKNFLDRWSRKKLDPKEGESSTPEKTAALPPEEQEENFDALAREDDSAPSKVDKPGIAEPEFDLSKLPSIESITANTDVRMFMLPGVPMALKQAALRKVWVTDPKIRDFIGIAENQWDFTVNSPGFDFSAPVGDIKKMIADIMGKSEEEKAEEAASKAVSSEAGGDPEKSPSENSAKELAVNSTEQSVRLSEAEPEPSEKEVAPLEPPLAKKSEAENIALQENDATQNISYEMPKRRHGSALPG